jgi:hypothetical protein
VPMRISNLLIPFRPSPSSNPSLSARFPSKINSRKFAGGNLVANRRVDRMSRSSRAQKIQQLAQVVLIGTYEISLSVPFASARPQPVERQDFNANS